MQMIGAGNSLEIQPASLAGSVMVRSIEGNDMELTNHKSHDNQLR